MTRGSHFNRSLSSSLTERTSNRRAVFTGTTGYVLVAKLRGNRRMSGVNLKAPGGGHA